MKSSMAMFTVLVIQSSSSCKIHLVTPWVSSTTSPAAAVPATPPPAPGCRCGVSRPSTGGGGKRVVGGVETAPNEYPWQVALLYNSKPAPYCGGSLLSSRVVMTAAHCEVKWVQLVSVVVGEHDVTRDDGQQSVAVKRWLSHPDYNRRTLDSDLAILVLKQEVRFRAQVSPVCLPNPQTTYDSREALVTGWGTLYNGGPVPSTLVKAELRSLTNKQCVAGTLYSHSDITDRMICAAFPQRDSCQGDSGGPLMAYEGGGRYHSVIGIVSWGSGCAQPNAPGVYTRVTQFLQWINSKMEGETCARPLP